MIPGLVLKNNMDLTNSSDVKYVIEKSEKCGDLATLIRDYLGDYLEYFDEPHWHQIGTMGTYHFHTRDKEIFSKDIRDMLVLTKKLNALNKFDGFEYLLAGFKNKPQIYSSFYEVDVAYWCQSRDGFKELIFSPSVKDKILEFCSLSHQGQVLCECKRVAFNQSKFMKLANKLLGICKHYYDDIGDWPRDIRLDVVFDGATTNNIDQRICKLLTNAINSINRGDSESHFESEGLSATIRKREQAIPKKHGELIAAQAIHEKAGQFSKLSEDVQISLNMALDHYEAKAVQNMIKKARRKIPEGDIGAIFVETSHALPKIRNKVKELISQDTYANTPLISLWIQGKPVFSAWSKDQYFNEKMFTN